MTIPDAPSPDVYRLSIGTFVLRVPRMTFGQSVWTTGHALAAGLGQLGHELQADDAESIAAQLYCSGRASSLLAGLLVTEGERWQKARAEQLARQFDELETPEDQRQLAAALSRGLLLFLTSALLSQETSPKSLTAPTGEPIAGGESAPAATSISAPTSDQ